MTSTPPQRPAHSHYRWVICALLFWVTTANYIDRGVFGNLAPEMPNRLRDRKEAGMSPIGTCRWFFSAAYAISMLFMGRLMDVLGLRWGFVFACAFWGLASMSHAFAPEIGGLFGSAITGFFICRILLGLGEGGNFPAAIKTTAEWFPKSERALATGLFNSGSNVGGILVPWALPFVVASSRADIGGIGVGWRGAFIITAVIDLCWIIAWLRSTRSPRSIRRSTRRNSRSFKASRRTDRQNPLAQAAAAQTDLGLRRGQVHDRLFLVVLSFRFAGFLQQKIQSGPGRPQIHDHDDLRGGLGGQHCRRLAGRALHEAGLERQQGPQDHDAHLRRLRVAGGLFGRDR